MRTAPLALVASLSFVLSLAAAPTMASAAGERPAPPWATGESRGDDLRITLITFGPGSDVASLFGHSALYVEDTAKLEGRVYNYGMFSFDRTLLVRYALGKLTFWLGESGIERTLRIYRAQGREIVAQELVLPPAERAAFAAFMAWNALPEHRGYLYDHFLDNCATRPRDVIDRFTGGALRRVAAQPASMSLRDHVRRYTVTQPAVLLLFDFLLNADVERPITAWEEGFLPAELSADVAAAGIAGPPRLIASAVNRPPIADAPPRSGLALFALGTLVGGIGVALAALNRRGRAWQRLLGVHQLVVGLTLGIPGLVLALLWAITEHRATYANENLLLANPLTLGVALAGAALLFKASERALFVLEVAWLSLAATSTFALVAKVLPLFDQDNGPLLALLLPINLSGALVAVLVRRSVEPVENAR
ncbi:MAG: DUF4105 domain-containing protein [Deltaproteobacteria bacterium]|nr:DUF4105 domain-containing protein [Deltaproteobacteria bacterium]